MICIYYLKNLYIFTVYSEMFVDNVFMNLVGSNHMPAYTKIFQHIFSAEIYYTTYA